MRHFSRFSYIVIVVILLSTYPNGMWLIFFPSNIFVILFLSALGMSRWWNSYLEQHRWRFYLLSIMEASSCFSLLLRLSLSYPEIPIDVSLDGAVIFTEKKYEKRSFHGYLLFIMWITGKPWHTKKAQLSNSKNVNFGCVSSFWLFIEPFSGVEWM